MKCNLFATITAASLKVDLKSVRIGWDATGNDYHLSILKTAMDPVAQWQRRVVKGKIASGPRTYTGTKYQNTNSD